MALLNESGSIKYWEKGLPAEGALLEANDAGTCKYWFNGLQAEWVNPTAGGAPPPPSDERFIHHPEVISFGKI